MKYDYDFEILERDHRISELERRISSQKHRIEALETLVDTINDTTRHDHGLIPTYIVIAAGFLRRRPEGKE